MKNRSAPSPEASHNLMDAYGGIAWFVLSLLLFGLVFLPLLLV